MNILSVKSLSRVALFALIVGALFSGANASAQSREELDKWIQILVDIRNNQCKSEHKNKVRGKIEYAAVLLAHSEIEEAEMSLAKAASKAQDSGCRDAITKNGKFANLN
ncbi:MAG: hypothetical protein OEY50_10940 [Nitrospinota bacterium]|nr:hypothetical protein [Nitrospinota bacterium]MDH5677229.1 hypothetical protein [Nitrospinota bacterium]MDH5756323.1 hypothetical protein [Nitrospinota bacterium]